MKYSSRELMDIAYETAKESFGKESFNFAALWAKTWSKAKDFRKDSIENWIGAFYTELLIDPRFVYIGTHQWRLREFMDYTEYLKEIGKRAQDVKFSDPDDSEGDTKDKGDVKLAGKKRGPKKKREVMLEAQDEEELIDSESSSDEESSESGEEENLDEDMERSAEVNRESDDDDEDSYD